MGETIKRGGIQKPGETSKGQSSKEVIQHGIQSPGSDFDRRPEVGSGPTYVGPSKTEGRSSAIKGGNSQKKKHKSTGKGQ